VTEVADDDVATGVDDADEEEDAGTDHENAKGVAPKEVGRAADKLIGLDRRGDTVSDFGGDREPPLIPADVLACPPTDPDE
jgi:hypothetical protein